MNTDLTPQRKKKWAPILLALIVLVLLVGAATSAFVYYFIQDQSFKSLTRRADTVVRLLPTDLIANLSATPNDLQNPDYVRLKGLLADARSANGDIRFAYLMGRHQGGGMFFYVDSENPGAPGYSYPGQEYQSVSQAMEEVFASGQGRVEIASDEYGTWLSGLVPVFGRDGRIIALFGLDTPALPYIFLSAAASAFPFLVALVLTLILFSIRKNLIREARTLEDRQEFLSLAAHEIRTPIAGIGWAIESMLRSGGAGYDTQTTETLSLMHATSSSLLQRVNNLLSVTRIEAAGTKLAKERVPVRPLLDDIVRTMEFASRKRSVQVVIDAAISEDLAVSADPQGAHHVFFNLISNAIKYANEGSTVRISYSIGDGKDLFTVANSGPGLTAEEAAHIFDGYHRTKTSIASGQEGTGLGLYLVKKTMELHGGAITVASNAAETAFTVTFPKG